MRKIWQKINTTIHKNKNKNPITFIKTEKGLITEHFITRNKFIKFFTTIASKLYSKAKKNCTFLVFLVNQNQFS